VTVLLKYLFEGECPSNIHLEGEYRQRALSNLIKRA